MSHLEQKYFKHLKIIIKGAGVKLPVRDMVAKCSLLIHFLLLNCLKINEIIASLRFVQHTENKCTVLEEVCRF